jgi:Ser/Thr protein kinase RdoA (MazF antagonist)
MEGHVARMREQVTAAAESGMDWGICHGDLSRRNIQVSEDGKWTIIDFDFCGPGWRAYDLTISQLPTLGRSGCGMWQALLNGYTQTRPLAGVDLAAVPLFRAVRHLWSFGLRASNTVQRGTLSISDGHFNSWLALFREWEAEYCEGK